MIYYYHLLLIIIIIIVIIMYYYYSWYKICFSIFYLITFYLICVPPGNMQPPMLQREGPPATYKDMLNMHHTYQGRNGHLNVPNG